MPPQALILYGDGINCEEETTFALKSVGFTTSLLHVTDLLASDNYLKTCQMLVIPGGFSFADEIRSGKVLALKLKDKLLSQLEHYIEQGNLLLGICNGFQVLTMLGLLPDPKIFGSHSATLINNQSGKFSDRWVKLLVDNSTKNPFIKGLETMTLPVRHGEGQLVVKKEISSSIKQFGCLRYEENFNGSFDSIAALTNKKGNVFGMMPHPEAFIRHSQHPAWTSLHNAKDAKSLPDGLVFFQNAFNALQ